MTGFMGGCLKDLKEDRPGQGLLDKLADILDIQPGGPAVAQGLAKALPHVVRNAVVHGLAALGVEPQDVVLG